MPNSRPANILLVEDNAGDIRLITEALKDTEIQLTLSVAKDGVEAMEFLRRAGQFGSAPRPSIVILDLNLPARNGREVLAEVKSDPGLKRLPVIVLSGSNSPQDILTSYDLNANCYIVKPRDLDDLMATMRSLVDFWLKRVRLPEDT